MGYLSCFVVLGYYTVVPVVLYVVIIKEWARYMIERASCKPTAIEKDKNTSGATQTSLKSHFTTSIIHKETFENNYLRWLVNECHALDTGESNDFKTMIIGLNSKATVPTRRSVVKKLHVKKVILVSLSSPTSSNPTLSSLHRILKWLIVEVRRAIPLKFRE